MSHQEHTRILAGIIAGAFVLLVSASAFAEDAAALKADAVAAKKLARKDHCLRCHILRKLAKAKRQAEVPA